MSDHDADDDDVEPWDRIEDPHLYDPSTLSPSSRVRWMDACDRHRSPMEEGAAAAIEGYYESSSSSGEEEADPPLPAPAAAAWDDDDPLAPYRDRFLKRDLTTVDIVRREFNLDGTVQQVRERFSVIANQVTDTYNSIRLVNVNQNNPVGVLRNVIENDHEVTERAVDRILFILDRCREIAENIVLVRDAISDRKDIDELDFDDMIRTYKRERMTWPDILKLQEFFLDLARSRNYRKLPLSEGHVDIYEPIENTVSFRRVSTVEEFIYQNGRADIYPDIYRLLHEATAVIPNIRTYLEKTPDSRFPYFVVTPSIRGFMNCYIDLDTCTTHFYEDNANAAARDMHRFIASHHHAGVSLEREWFRPRHHPPIVVNPETGKHCWEFTCRRFREPDIVLLYPVTENKPPPPLHIPMPAMLRLMIFQEYSPEMLFMFYAFVGRMLYRVGQRDSFEVIMLMTGKTGAGKSTVLEAIRAALFPDRSRIAILSSNKEDTFGLQTAYDKDAMFCDEMEKKPRWNLADIKSMAVGGWMSIARKFKEPVFTRWFSPILLASNYKAPDWNASSNDIMALLRRFVPFPFKNTCSVPDGDMASQLREESGALFATCLLCYDYLVTYIARSSFPRVAPPQLKACIREMYIALHPLARFLSDCREISILPPDDPNHDRRYFPLSTLSQLYDDWRKRSNLRNDNSWIPDFYLDPLKERGCRVDEAPMERPYPRDNMVDALPTIYVYGIDTSAHCRAIGEPVVY